MEHDGAEPGQAGTRSSRRGILGCISVVVVVALAVTIGAVKWLKSGESSGLLTASQLQSLQLSGTWKNADGAAIVFSNQFSGIDSAQGGVDFQNVPNVFVYESGSPPTSATGFWQTGTLHGSPAGLVITFQGGSAQQGSLTSVLLLAEGDASSPTLVCDTAAAASNCTFTKTQ